jgi:hypothetical protein
VVTPACRIVVALTTDALPMRRDATSRDCALALLNQLMVGGVLTEDQVPADVACLVPIEVVNLCAFGEWLPEGRGHDENVLTHMPALSSVRMVRLIDHDVTAVSDEAAE